MVASHLGVKTETLRELGLVPVPEADFAVESTSAVAELDAVPDSAAAVAVVAELPGSVERVPGSALVGSVGVESDPDLYLRCLQARLACAAGQLGVVDWAGDGHAYVVAADLVED